MSLGRARKVRAKTGKPKDMGPLVGDLVLKVLPFEGECRKGPLLFTKLHMVSQCPSLGLHPVVLVSQEMRQEKGQDVEVLKQQAHVQQTEKNEDANKQKELAKMRGPELLVAQVSRSGRFGLVLVGRSGW